MKRALDVAKGFYKPEISGAIKGLKSREKLTVDKFNSGVRVQQRFRNSFKIAYDSLVSAIFAFLILLCSPN